ncbi:MFS transporter [Georgenia sp. 10Sc9-8]|uniref:MFS transporter n=1 Tax=Georgenia halotolerans TaxID=3028317 RepID=A0ABT5TYG1_9MICO|nr:MFS transporter [Georgenia halotolerans]
MLGPYRQILSLPGTVGFSAAGLLARFPNSMVGIGVVLMVAGLYGSYGTAGRVSAAFVLALAVCAPQLARLVDRHGQARVMRPALAVALSSMLGLVLVARAEGPEWALYPFAVLGGATLGSMGSLVRSRWARAVRTPAELHTAFSLESSLDELGFVLGPVLATFLATSVTPSAGVLVALVLLAVGGYWFLGQRATEPVPSSVPRVSAPGTALLRSPAVLVLLVIFLCCGTLFGASDVATVAFAAEQGAPGLAGPLLGIFATGSFVAGLLYGSRQWETPLPRRLVIGIALLAAVVSLVLVADSLLALAAVLLVAGIGIAPTIINGTALLQQIVRPEQLTEGLSWMSTAVNLGVAVGSSVAGPLIDARGAVGGFAVVVAAGWAALATALAARGLLGRASARAAPTPPWEAPGRGTAEEA